ncbi:retrovirus-related pol polyprotein from transposon TNT 1-94 [Tanacetum coccineum]
MSYTDKSICLWPGCLSVMHASVDGDRGKQTYQSQMPLYSQLEGTGSSVGTAEGSAEASYSGNVYSTPGSVVVTTGSVVVTTGSVVVTPGSVVVTPGSVVVTTGSVVVTPGSVVVTPGSVVVTTGSVVVTPGSVVVTTRVSQQIELDNALVSLENRRVIDKCNMRINPGMKPKQTTYQVALDALDLTICYPAFLITAEVLVIYMHQFWATVTKHKASYRFKIDNKKFSVNVGVLRYILNICPRILG